MIIWISRGYPKYFGFPMDLQISWIHGYPRIFSIREEINGYLWQSMVIYGNPWKSMDIHGYPKYTWISKNCQHSHAILDGKEVSSNNQTL